MWFKVEVETRTRREAALPGRARNQVQPYHQHRGRRRPALRRSADPETMNPGRSPLQRLVRLAGTGSRIRTQPHSLPARCWATSQIQSECRARLSSLTRTCFGRESRKSPPSPLAPRMRDVVAAGWLAIRNQQSGIPHSRIPEDEFPESGELRTQNADAKIQSSGAPNHIPLPLYPIMRLPQRDHYGVIPAFGRRITRRTMAARIARTPPNRNPADGDM